MKKTFKKSISLIMAVIMVMSCWVWVAPQKASAAAGSYTVRLTVNVTNHADGSTGHIQDSYWRITYITDNGTGTQDTIDFDLKNDEVGNFLLTEQDNVSVNFNNIPGFPTAIYVYHDADWQDRVHYTLTKIEIGGTKFSTFWTGSEPIHSGGVGNSEYEKDFGSIPASMYPYADSTTVSWSDTPENVTCPKTASDAAKTQTVKVTAKDQYGVQMFDPTWSISGSNKSDGLSVNPTSSSESTTISVNSSANIAGDTNSQTGTVKATWNTPKSSVKTSVSATKTFTITDATYDVTFTGHKDSSGTEQPDYKTTVQYGVTPSAPASYDYAAGDYDFSFAGWNPSVGQIIADTTYTAVYSKSKQILADYTAVDDAISAANAIKAQYGTEYELKYTLASRVALDSAINAVVRGKGRTQQDTVDGYAEAINNAIAALEPNKFDVIFLDKFGAILLYEKNAEYKTEVTAPTFPEEQKVYYDADNHYTYTGWDNDEYLSVIDDLVINPVYTAQAHTFETSTVTSNCVTKGATKYTCTVCGYSYVDGETDYGDHVWASDFTVDLEPTCTLPGSKSIHCTLCDAQKDITVIDPLGHNWSSQSVAVEATCGKIGIMTKVCDDCGVCEHTMIDALEHDYVETVVAPTCTTKGYTEYTCQRSGCGFTYRDNYTDVTAHRFGNWETVYAAACEVKGLEKRVCADCGFMELQTTAALSHITPDSWTVITSATCTGTGYQVKNCTLCGLLMDSEVVEKLGHAYTVTSETQANCTEAGVKTETCSRCGDTNTTVTQPTGHTYDSGVVNEADCTHGGFKVYTCQCGDKKYELIDGALANGHDFTNGKEEVTKAPTCTEEGQKTIQCVNDGCQFKKTQVISKLGHNMKAGTVVAATCTTSGYTPYTCDNGCGYTYNVFDADALGHDYVGQVTKAASCTADGEKTYICQNDSSHTYKETIPATGHNYVKGTVTAATCTTPATEVYTCACGETYTKYVAPSNGHSWGDWVKVQDATEDKYGIEKKVCSVCQAEELRTTQPIGDHEFTSEITKEANCTEDGEKKYTCQKHADCSANYTETIPALGHKEKLVYIAATCASTGKAQIVCETCDAELSAAQTIPMLAHTYGSGTVATPATCTEDGVMTYICTACGAQRTETIEKTGHSLSSQYNAPSCTQAGSIVTTCSKCSYTTTESIPAAGHKLEVKVVDSTCTTKGTVTEKCTVCDYEKVTELELKNHKFGGTAISETEATCTTDGEKTFKCETCNEEVTVTTPKLGHSYPDEWTTESEADCTTDGKKTKTCATCGDVITEVLPKTGHNWGAWVKVDATNDTDGSWTRTCQNDPNHVETVVIPKGGHAFENAPEITKPASCTETGTAVYKCSAHENCGVTVTVTLAVIPHTIITEEKAATCTEKGYVKTVCSACKEVFTNEDREIVPHTYDGGTFIGATCTTNGYTIYTCMACLNEIRIYNKNEPATGHSLVEGESTATCTNEGLMTLTCEKCDYSDTVSVPALGHNYVEAADEATDATCAAPATKTYKCSCGAAYTISVGNKTEDHKWDDTKWQVIVSATESSIGYKTNACTVCGQLKVETIEATGEHSFIGGEVIDSKPATCTENGYEIVKCKTHDDCGVETTITLYATGHKENLVYTPADCDTAGSTKIVCGVCGAERDEKTIPALGHLWSEGKVTNATCAEAGKIEYTCTRDNCTATKETVIATNANAHQYETTVTAPTCTATGLVITKCKLCDKTTTEKVLEKVEHNWGAPSVTAATCEKDGSRVYTCTVCSATKTEVIAKTGHNWGDWEVTTESTNTTEGVLTRECANGCKEEVNFPAGGHNLVEDTDKYVAPTCTQTGTKAYKCSAHENCGISLEVTLDKIQHTFKTTTEAATCTADGSVVTTCKNCGDKKTEIIKAKGHTWADTPESTVPAKCEEKGSATYKCENCGETKTIEIPALGHIYEAKDVIAPTCTTSGYTVYVCKNDANHKYNVYDASKPAVPHDFGEWAVVTNATQETDGLERRECNNCDAYEEKVIPAMKHNMVVVSTKTATCTSEGEIVYKCETKHDGVVCDYTLTVVTSKIAHTLKTVVTDAKCDIDGSVVTSCENCDTVNVTTLIPALGHKYIGTETKAATCTENGTMTYICQNDATHQYTETIPATGHSYEAVLTAPTCTAEGYTTYTCACGDSYKDNYVAALGHSFGLWTDTGSDDVHTRYCSRCDATETQAHAWDEGEIITAPSFNNDGEMLYTCLICGGTKITGIDADIDENAPTGEIKWNATLWNDFLSVITFGTYVNYDVKLEITAQDKETGINSIEYYVADKALTLDEVKALTSWKEYDSANKLTVSAQDAAKVVVYAKITDKSGNATYISTDGIVFDTVAPVLGIEADKGNAQTNVYCTPVTVVVNDANISHAIYDGKTVALTTDKFYCNEAGAHTLTVFDKAGNSTDISFTINAAHTWTKAPLADDSNLKTEATCEDKAVYYVACSVCGEIGEETFEYGSAAGHNYKGTVTVPATCEEDGVMTYICQNDNSHTYTEIIPASGHTELAATEENRKEATCEENGYYELAVYCGVCGEELDRTSHVIPATGHNYIGSVTKAPTCTQEGVMTYVCANDWKHAYSEEIPALGHTDENNDCTCEVCGEKCCLDSNLYVRVVEPSCTTKGYSVRTCKNCKSETKTEIPALGHKEVVTYVDATCNKYAHKIITCSACDNYYEEIYTDNAYAPHAVVVVPGKPATCVSDGYTEYERCVNCGMVTQAQTLYKEDVPHVDADGNGKCDVCDGKFFTDTKTCNCLCHGTGIKGFLYKIALFFWKLFKMNKSCACGTVHYE